MKKLICVVTVLLLLLCGCSSDVAFTEKENGVLVREDGVEYVHVANEGRLYYLGEREFVGRVAGEKRFNRHLGGKFQTGMFAIKGSENDNVLIRCLPDSEWLGIYRKASLPAFDFSVERCIRLELVMEHWDIEAHGVHTTCVQGLTDPSEIAAFLADVRAQKSPREAGLYDLVRKPDGSLENCAVNAVIYGFFAEEPNLVLLMEVTSYNGLAYSVSIEGKDYVLPASWMEKLAAQ